MHGTVGGPLRLCLPLQALMLAAAIAIMPAAAHAAGPGFGLFARHTRLQAIPGCRPCSVAPPERCAYVREHCADLSGNVVDFLEMHFCELDDRPWASLLLQLAWMLLMLLIMLEACDRFFCPSIERISEWLRLSPTVAGATLLAFGNGAADLFMQIRMALSGPPRGQGFELALTEPLGTGMFVTHMVVAGIILVTPMRRVHVSRLNFMKDCCFFLGGVAALLAMLIRGSMDRWQIFLPGLYYVVYICITVLLARGAEPLHADPRRHEVPHFRTTSYLDDVFVQRAVTELEAELQLQLEQEQEREVERQASLARKEQLMLGSAKAREEPEPPRDGKCASAGMETALKGVHDLGCGPEAGSQGLVRLDIYCHAEPGHAFEPDAAACCEGSCTEAAGAVPAILAAEHAAPARLPLERCASDASISSNASWRAGSGEWACTCSRIAGAEQGWSHGLNPPPQLSPLVPPQYAHPQQYSTVRYGLQQLSLVPHDGLQAPLLDPDRGGDALARSLEQLERRRHELRQEQCMRWWLLLGPSQWWRLLRTPIRVLLCLTLPLVSNRKGSGARYHKCYATLLPLVMPLLLAIYCFGFNPWTADWMGSWELQVAAAACAAAALLLLLVYPTHGRLQGWLLGVCTVVAFLGSILWIQFCADEVVAVTMACGAIFDISNPLLTATVLSWASAAGDAISNLALARDGFPTMALTACFSSPLFVLLGGLTCTLVIFSREGTGAILLPSASELQVLYGSCVVCCTVWVVTMPLIFRYKLTCTTAVMAIVMYVTFQAVYIIYAI